MSPDMSMPEPLLASDEPPACEVVNAGGKGARSGRLRSRVEPGATAA